MPSSPIVQRPASHNRNVEVCHSKMTNGPHLRTRQEIMAPIIPSLICHVSVEKKWNPLYGMTIFQIKWYRKKAFKMQGIFN